MREEYNSSGEKLQADRKYRRLKDEFFGKDGMPLWKQFIHHGDEQGFDIRYEGPDGAHVERIILQIGRKVVRYGNDRGSFTTDPGTPYSLLSMPFEELSLPYHEYIVLGECEVLCIVLKGRVAPGFLSEGGAVQYYHEHTMRESIRMGILKEDWKWLK